MSNLEFCLSCKACKSECPSNVDMAKLKAEFEYGWQQKNRLSDEHVYFSRAYKAYKYAIKYPRVSNYIISKEFGKHMLNVFFGISKARTLPALSLNPFNVKEYEFPKTAQNPKTPKPQNPKTPWRKLEANKAKKKHCKLI